MDETLDLPPSNGDKVSRTAIIALAAIGLLEFGAVAVHYVQSYRAAHPPKPAAVVPAATPVATAAPSASAAPAAAAAASTPASPADRVLQEATSLRERGDNANALARLQDAERLDPKNANVFAEMAMVYESMQQLDRANDYWRKIQELGPSAGALYQLADTRLKMGVAAPSAPPAAAGPGLVGASPLDAGTARDDADGIPDGSTFGITETTITDNNDPDAETNVTLRVAVKARPQTPIDHTKVKIQVYFYDTINNKDVVLTDADVSYEWVTPNHDWKGTNPEVLAVTYVRPKNRAGTSESAISAAAAAVTPGKKGSSRRKDDTSGKRKYSGYIVRVYYNDQLQAVRAEPTKLLNLFPPPFTAPSQ